MDALRFRFVRATQISVVVALAFIAAGCTKLVYNRLDTLAGWYLGSLVSLEPQQHEDLRSWLTRTLEWHRASELGRYAGFLRELANQVSTPGDRAAYERAEQRIEAFGEAVIAQTAPEAARLLTLLSPAQLDEFEKKLEERSLERSEEAQKAIAKGAWRRDRARDLRRQLKRWTGSVTDEQQVLIGQSVVQLEPMANDWLESQSQWRRLLLETLRAQTAMAAKEQRVLELLRQPDTQWTADYNSKNERNRNHSLALLEALDASLTSAQRERLRRELTELAGQLDDLRETAE
ncbi:MAG: DUF6279 family lipoprotein [Steroidobacter sp.]